MVSEKYVGLDVHQASTVAVVQDAQGRGLMECTVETTGSAIRDLLRGLTGRVHVTCEEGTQAGWLYEVTRPLVAEVVVCDPRQNRLLGSGNKGDRVDARKLATLLRGGYLKPVYHGAPGLRTLKELVHSYDGFVVDSTRVMNRLKGLFRSRAIQCAGRDVYYERHRDAWLAKLEEPGLRQRATLLYTELDQLKALRRAAKRAMLAEARGHRGYALLQQVPVLGPIRVSQILAAIGAPQRFRTKRQLWAYCGLAVVTRASAEYEMVDGQARRRSRVPMTRGLNINLNHRLKYVFKSAALDGVRREPFRTYYQRLVAQGMRPELARVTLARKIAAITLAVWKKEGRFDERLLTPAA